MRAPVVKLTYHKKAPHPHRSEQFIGAVHNGDFAVITTLAQRNASFNRCMAGANNDNRRFHLCINHICFSFRFNFINRNIWRKLPHAETFLAIFTVKNSKVCNHHINATLPR